MKMRDQNRALTKRDLLCKLQKVEKALGAQAQRADAVERENSRLLSELIRLQPKVGAATVPRVYEQGNASASASNTIDAAT